MSNLKKIFYALNTFLLYAAVISCSSTEKLAPEKTAIEVTPEVREQIGKMGFDASDLQVVTPNDPVQGKGKPSFLVEGDVIITPEALDDMLAGKNAETWEEQAYTCTTGIVSAPRTISVIGYTGGSNALTTKMRDGLQMAIENYNNLGLTIRFTLTFAASTNADIVVYRVASSSAGGSAGFPSGGEPYQWVQILGGLNNYSVDVNEHVMTHEIGHCIGLRHTDWQNRNYSCGSGGNEGTSPYGACFIPGTINTTDPNSIMLSCFSSNETGEFGSYDIVALNYLY